MYWVRVFGLAIQFFLLSTVVSEFATLAFHSRGRLDTHSLHYHFSYLHSLSSFLPIIIWTGPWPMFLPTQRVSIDHFVNSLVSLFQGTVVGMWFYMARREQCKIADSHYMRADGFLGMEITAVLTRLLMRDSILLTWYFIIGGPRVARFMPRAMLLLGHHYVNLWLDPRPVYDIQLDSWDDDDDDGHDHDHNHDDHDDDGHDDEEEEQAQDETQTERLPN